MYVGKKIQILLTKVDEGHYLKTESMINKVITDRAQEMKLTSEASSMSILTTTFIISITSELDVHIP